MDPLAKGMNDDLAWPQRLTVPDGRRIEPRRERHENPIRTERRGGDAGELLVAAQKMQLPHVRPGQTRLDGSAADDDELDLRFFDIRFIVAGLGESMGPSSPHCSRPVRRPTRRFARGEPGWEGRTKRRIYGRRLTRRYANTGSAEKFRVWGASSAGRRSVAVGVSPKRPGYATEKRPSSQKPCAMAIEVTVALRSLAMSSARRARCIRRSHR